MRRQGGFVLVNALIIVAALAAAAIFMLSRAESSRVRGAAALQAAQLELYLDGFEALAKVVLQQGSPSGGKVAERKVPPVPLDRGQVTGQIRDLQGRFNLNLLADPADILARAAFERLALWRGLSSQRVAEIAAFVSPDGPADAQLYAHGDDPMRPVGGAILMVEQLRQIPHLTAKDYNRLTPYVTVLPDQAPINVNTVSKEVLASFFPKVEAAQFGGLVQGARRQPFQSLEAFHIELLKIVSPEAVEALPPVIFGVESSWFEVEIIAELEGRVAKRRVVINRLSLSQQPVVAYRLDNWNYGG